MDEYLLGDLVVFINNFKCVGGFWNLNRLKCLYIKKVGILLCIV